MNFLPVFNISWGAALFFIGIYSFPYVVVWTLLSEAFALYHIKFHQSFWHCLKLSAIANLVSGAVGLIWQFRFSGTEFYISWFENLVESLPSEYINKWWDWDIFLFFAILLLLIINWVGSVLLETIVLLVSKFSQHDLSVTDLPRIKKMSLYTLKAGLVINTVSYIGLTVGMLLWLLISEL